MVLVIVKFEIFLVRLPERVYRTDLFIKELPILLDLKFQPFTLGGLSGRLLAFHLYLLYLSIFSSVLSIICNIILLLLKQFHQHLCIHDMPVYTRMVYLIRQ